MDQVPRGRQGPRGGRGRADRDAPPPTRSSTTASPRSRPRRRRWPGRPAELKAAFADIAKAAAGEALAGFRREFAPALKRADLPGGRRDEPKAYATCRRYKTLECFPNNEQGYEKAYRFGMWCLANATKHSQQFHTPWAVEWCRKNGLGFTADVETDSRDGRDVRTKAGRENSNTSVGFLVPDEFENDLIDLRERYGVFRKYAKKVPMAGDTRSDPRRRGGVTAYWVGESQSASYSDKTWDRVRLTAKKLMALTRISNEINEDAVINLGDDYAREIVYAFANKEDQAGFNGDGSGAYGGITGIRQALLNVDATIANVLGLRVATRHRLRQQLQRITLADFNAVVGLLPEFADNDNTAWFVHRTFWGSVMQRLATAAGGNRVDEIAGGRAAEDVPGLPGRRDAGDAQDAGRQPGRRAAGRPVAWRPASATAGPPRCSSATWRTTPSSRTRS